MSAENFGPGAIIPSPDPTPAKTEVLGTRLVDIPFDGLEAVGRIFAEGAVKYGVGNWRKGAGDAAYTEERTNHAIRHLMLWANGDRGEEHLAKVAWFCLTTIWAESRKGGAQ